MPRLLYLLGRVKVFMVDRAEDVWSFIAPAPELWRDPDELREERLAEMQREQGFEVLPPEGGEEIR